MRILNITISGQHISWDNPFDIVAGSCGYLYCRFTAGDDWDGVSKSVRFYKSKSGNGNDNIFGVTKLDGLVRVPNEVLNGKYFYIAVGGYTSSNDGSAEDVFIPTAALRIDLRENGFGEPDAEVQEGEQYKSTYEQLLDLAEECRSAAERMENVIPKFTPYIGEDNYWYVYDPENNQHVKSDAPATGVGIAKVEKTSSEENVDTYTFTFTDGNTFSFTVSNGAGGNGSIKVDDKMSPTSENPVQNKVVMQFIVERDTELQGAVSHFAKVANDAATIAEEASKNLAEHTTSEEAHNDIRILVTDLGERLNALADSGDIELDQLSEIVAYIKSNKSLIDSITTSKVSVADIIDNLTTNVSNRPLSAKQGVELKKLIDENYSTLQGGNSAAWGMANKAQGTAESAYNLATSAGNFALQVQTTAEEALGRLADKQDKVEIVTDDTSTSIVFSALEFYNSDHRVKTSPDSIDFNFPTGEYSQDYITGLSFYSDDTPPTISYTVGNIINWVGTDCSIDTYTELNGEVLPVSIFQPSANTQYDIIIYFNGACFVGMVNGYKIASYNKKPSNGGDITEF